MEKIYKGWKDELQSLLNANLSTRDDGGIASGKTQDDRANYLFSFFNLLREHGYAVDPHNIKQKHIQFACDYYLSDKEKDGRPKASLSPATIQAYLSMLRSFARWIGKNGMVGSASKYISDESKYTRTYAAMEDKGFEGRGVNIREVILQIRSEYPYVYHQMLAQTAFGLRCKESLSLRPFIHLVEDTVQILDGSKNGKPRVIPIENDNQIEVAKTLKQFIGKTSQSLMEPRLSLPQNYSKYYRVCKKFGLTKKELGNMHSSRSDYAMNFMMSEGLIPLVKGGEVGQLPKEQEMEIRLAASQRLGHNRVSITTAYSGPLSEAGKRKIDKKKNDKS